MKQHPSPVVKMHDDLHHNSSTTTMMIVFYFGIHTISTTHSTSVIIKKFLSIPLYRLTSVLYLDLFITLPY
jgi:hypothetical protein